MEVLLGTWHIGRISSLALKSMIPPSFANPPPTHTQFVVQQMESSSIADLYCLSCEWGGAALSWQLHVGHSLPLSCVAYFVPVHVDYDWAINWKLTNQRSLFHLSLVFFFLNSVGTPLRYVQSVLSCYYGPSSMEHRSIMEVVLNLNSDIYWYLNYQFWWHP